MKPLDYLAMHSIRHYAGLAAMHLGFVMRCVGAGDFWSVSRNHEMAFAAMELAVGDWNPEMMVPASACELSVPACECCGAVAPSGWSFCLSCSSQVAFEA